MPAMPPTGETNINPDKKRERDQTRRDLTRLYFSIHIPSPTAIQIFYEAVRFIVA